MFMRTEINIVINPYKTTTAEGHSIAMVRERLDN